MSKFKNHKHAVALLLVVCILATTFFSAVPFLGVSAKEPENLISNGTFDSEILPYNAAASYDNFKSVEPSGRTDDITGSGYIGNGGAFNNGSSDNPVCGLLDGKQGIVQNIDIESDKTYKLSFDWGRNGNYEESDLKVVIRYSDPANGGWQTLYEKVFYSSYTWQFTEYVDYLSVDTSAAEAINADIQIMFTMYFDGHTSGHNAYLDNISLTESSKELQPEISPVMSENFTDFNQPANGGYAQNDDAIWYLNGTFATIDGGAALNGGNADGNEVLKATQHFTWIRIFANVEAGKEYKLSFKWAAGTLDGAQNTIKSTYAYVNSVTPNGNSYDVSWVTNSGGGVDWADETHSATGYALKEYSRTITPTRDGLICIGFKGSNTTAVSYFDDVVLKKTNEDIIENVDSAESIELVRDGDFENGGRVSDEWLAYARTAATSENACEGEYSVEIDGYTDGLLQYVTIEKGRTYKLSFDWDANTEAVERKMGVTLDDVFSTTVIASVGGYNKYTYTFVATKNAVLPLKFDRGRYAGKIYIDNISLRTVVNNAGEDYIAGGDFEAAPEADSKSDFIADNKKGWCAPSSQWATDKYVSGTHSLKASDTDSAFGAFAVDPESTVRLSFNYFGETGSSARITVSADADGNDILLSKTVNGSGAWQQIIEEFDVKKAETVYISIDSLEGNNWFDDVSLIKLYKVSVMASNHIDVTADKKGVLSGETVTLTVNSVAEGYALKEGYPIYTLGDSSAAMTAQSDNVYTLVAGEGDLTISVETSAAVGYELLPDVGFESGEFSDSADDGWLVGTFGDGSAQGSFSEDSYEGKYALLLRNQSYLGADYNGIRLEKGSTYRLSLYHYGAVDIDTQMSGIALIYDNGSYSETLYEFEVGDDDDWNRYSFEFTPDDDYVVTARIKNHGSGSASALFDNVSLKKIVPGSSDPDAWQGNYDYSRETAPSTDELLKDRSFEDYEFLTDATQGWKVKNTNANQYVSFSGASWSLADGETSVRIGAGGLDAVYQVIKVKPGTSYKISFDILVDQEGAGIKIGNSIDSPDSMLDMCDLPVTHEMASYSAYFQSEAQNTAYIFLWNGCLNEAAYYDNFSITELDDRIVGDLGFRKTARITANVGETDTTVIWPTVKSKLYHNEDLTYDIYYSDKPITEDNISALTPIASQNGKERRTYKITGLDDETTYYYAIVGKDPAGNTALLSSEGIATLAAPTYAVKNGGFETGDIAGWYNLDNHIARAHTSSFSGKYCVEVKGWLTALYQPVLVEPNAKYVWSFAGADQTGKANFYIFSSAAMADTAPHYVKQTFDATQAWTVYSGTFTTAAEQERVVLALKNNLNGLYVYADNFYLKKIVNEDLYFISEPADVMNGPSFIVFEWQPVVSKDKAENITYTVYYSEAPINDGNIGLLKPYVTNEGADSTFATITGLELDKGYYVAVQAKDSLGNIVTEYSSHPFFAREIVLADTEEEDSDGEQTDNSQGDEATENMPEKSEDGKPPVIDLNKNDTVVEDTLDEEEVTEPTTETQETTTYIKKAVSDIAYGKLIPAIVLFIVAAALVVISILLLKKRYNKLNIVAIAAIVLAAVLVALGVWLALTSFTTVIKTEAKTSTQEVIVESSDVSSTDDTSSEQYVSSETETPDDQSGTQEEKERTESEDSTSSDTSSVIVTPEESTYKTYYVSSSTGNDSNDGLTPETAIKTINKVNSLSLQKGDSVLFKSGDIWRAGRVDCAIDVTYSSYGEGEKPTFYGGYKNLSGAENWVETEYPNVYTLAKNIGVVGTFWFDNDKQYAIMDAPYGEVGSKVMITPDMLTEDLHFCCDYETGEVFLYSEKGNPGSRFDSIEAVPDARAFAINDGTTIENLRVKYYDYGITGTDISDATVRNMDMSRIGGVWATNLESRAGNAIEFWKNTDNVLIEDNTISQCYDTAITCQFTGSESNMDNVIIKDVTVRGNKISDCWWSTEFWLKMPGSGKGEIKNLVITENEFKNAGMGWGSRTGANYTVHSYHIHCFAYTNYNSVDIKITNNVFDMSKYSLFCFGWTDYMPTLRGNTYIQSSSGQFGYIYQRPLAFNSNMFEVIRQFDKDAVLTVKD